MTDTVIDPAPPPPSLAEIGWQFLQLGALVQGESPAQLALIEQTLVRRRRWLAAPRFRELRDEAELLTGSAVTQLAIAIGRQLGGWPAGIAAGVAFIAPGALLATALAEAYRRYGSLPTMGAIRHGIAPLVIALFVPVLWRLSAFVLKAPRLIALVAAAALAAALGLGPLPILAAAALLALVAPASPSPLLLAPPVSPPAPASPASPPVAPDLGQPMTPPVAPDLAQLVASALAAPFALSKLFLVLVAAGALLFGSDQLLLVFVRHDLVGHLRWIDDRQLLDAAAAGHLVPGPFLAIATFLGHLLGRGLGALVATAAVVLPAFLWAAAAPQILPFVRRAPRAARLLDALRAAALALLAVVACQLAPTALPDLPSLALATLGGIALLRYRIPPAVLLLGGAAVGWLWR